MKILVLYYANIFYEMNHFSTSVGLILLQLFILACKFTHNLQLSTG
jgi:hypothetical protein